VEDFFEYGNRIRVQKRQGISRPVERLSTSQKGFFFMVLISYNMKILAKEFTSC
jgi:hypothetical protein